MGHALLPALILSFGLAAAQPPDVNVTDITSSPQLAFAPAGVLLPVGAYARIVTTVSYHPYLIACERIRPHLKAWYELLPEDSYGRHHDAWQRKSLYNAVRARVFNACDNLLHWHSKGSLFGKPGLRPKRQDAPAAPAHAKVAMAFATTPIQPPFNAVIPRPAAAVSRQPRGIPAIAAFVIGAGSLLFNLVRLLVGGATPAWEERATAPIELAKGARATSFAIVNLAQGLKDIWDNDHFVAQLTGLIDSTRSLAISLEHLEEAIFDLQRGHIHPLFLGTRDIDSALDRLADKAAASHMYLSVSSVADVLLLPIYGVKSGFNITTIVPIPAVTDRLYLHRFMGTPLIFHNSTTDSRVLQEARPIHTTIAAATRSPNHILLTQNDLNSCFRTHSTFMCANLPVRLNRHSSCLGALFSASASAIQQQCQFAPHPEPWHVARVRSSAFAITTLGPLTATTSCPSGASSAVNIPWGVHLLTVPPGCTTQTRHFSIASPLANFAQVEIVKTLSWSMPPPVNFSVASSVPPALKRHISVALQDALYAKLHSDKAMTLAAAAAAPWWHHVTWGSVLLLILCIIAVAAGYRYCGSSPAAKAAADAAAATAALQSAAAAAATTARSAAASAASSIAAATANQPQAPPRAAAQPAPLFHP